MSQLKTRGGKWFLLIAAFAVVALLAGCTPSTVQTHTTADLLNHGWWNRYVVYWFAYALDTFANWFNGEYGLAVLVLVLIVRTLILPLTLKQVKSSKAMQAIQPQLQKLREQYKDDPQKQQAETMKLFQENQVNPAAGCFPLLIQMPIFIALYNAIIYNSALREHTFLWLQLGEPDKFHILPLIAAATTFLQTWMMMRMNPASMQGPMQMMMYIYPVIIAIMSWTFPAALPLYWVYSNIYTIVQNYFLYRNNQPVVTDLGVAVDPGKTPSANRNRNKKKSKKKRR
ncbi:YidC/Oxa1 family membrane protein insertase [Paenibacillus hunanensis]|uniref:Membrane protein insertase YidC n=1 Tax=Paenibacillus hunanensis TaxID=539262 RepID=A0ABU1J5W2_9BACL|nr:YidC/Oxa1 family membrane protein insertase [Paenibacillus hunanensis]MCL9663306.1 YidC/Oxa1 family membrane protein insertase [Paenibacillus hunanensis]MDR6246367.1 YidC/Oxa1 family membrane protein insertase [Paenibacillus hunanensis]WPP41405.1 YidC/Oxa1 family membrane protein insertase [Paenibacillus hunanensis]